MRGGILVLLAAAVVFAGCGDSSSPDNSATKTRTVVLHTDCGKPTAKPQTIVLACADYGLQLRGLKWSHWGDRRANAKGTIDIHGCDPDCADDNRTYTYTVEVTAHQPITCSDGERRYAYINYAITGSRYDEHRPDDDTRGYDCP
jgi:hypothetical protein